MVEDIGVVREYGALLHDRMMVTLNAVESDSGYNNKRHYHNFYEFEFAEDGETTYEINSKPTRLSRGFVHLITPMDYHSQIIAENEKFTYYNISFCEDAVADEVTSMLYTLPRPLVYRFPEDEYKIIKRELDELRAECAGGSENNLLHRRLIKNRVECLIIRFARAILASSGGFQYNSAIEKDGNMIRAALTYIRMNYNKDISLASAAEHLNLSRTYFSSFFSQAMNMSFWEYVQTYRLNIAASMLGGTSLPADIIARETGYKNYSSFYVAFKKHFNVSPNEYKKYYK